MDIQKLKDEAFIEAVDELKKEYSSDLKTLEKIEDYAKKNR